MWLWVSLKETQRKLDRGEPSTSTLHSLTPKRLTGSPQSWRQRLRYFALTSHRKVGMNLKGLKKVLDLGMGVPTLNASRESSFTNLRCRRGHFSGTTSILVRRHSLIEVSRTGSCPDRRPSLRPPVSDGNVTHVSAWGAEGSFMELLTKVWRQFLKYRYVTLSGSRGVKDTKSPFCPPGSPFALFSLVLSLVVFVCWPFLREFWVLISPCVLHLPSGTGGRFCNQRLQGRLPETYKIPWN